MKMYIDLFFNTFDDEYEFKDITNEEKFDYLIKYSKIQIYFNKIIDLEKDVRLKLVALKELYSNVRIVISKNRRNSILNEINNLTNTLVVFESSKVSIFLKLKSYINMDIHNINESEINELILKKKN